MHYEHMFQGMDFYIYFEGMLCLLDNHYLARILVGIPHMDHLEILVNMNKFHCDIVHLNHMALDYMDQKSLDLLLKIREIFVKNLR